MRTTGGKARRLAGAVALAVWLVASPAKAQSVSDYRLPGTNETPNPRSQGPVDPDNPVVRGPAPRPTTSPSPSVTETAPAPQSGPTRTAQPSAPPPSRAATPAPNGREPGPGLALPGATTSAPATPAPSLSLPAAGATGLPTFGPIAEPTQSATAASPSVLSYWPWLAGAAGLLVLLSGLAWWWRRRPAREPVIDFEPPRVAEPAPVAAAPRDEAPSPDPEPASVPEPIMAPAPTGLGIALDARRMSASLVATTLSYNLRLTNHTDQPLSALAIEGDMVAAHASLPPERQIASDHERLELRHALVELAPGESAEFSGDFRLPLAAVTPIRAGHAAYFVPLARLRIEASTPEGSPLIAVQTFVIGEVPENPAAALRPFRLDLGPRTYSNVGQRAVS